MDQPWRSLRPAVSTREPPRDVISGTRRGKKKKKKRSRLISGSFNFPFPCCSLVAGRGSTRAFHLLRCLVLPARYTVDTHSLPGTYSPVLPPCRSPVRGYFWSGCGGLKASGCLNLGSFRFHSFSFVFFLFCRFRSGRLTWLFDPIEGILGTIGTVNGLKRL